MESLESKVEQICALIMRTDNENWDTKNKAIVQMTEMFLEQGDDVEVFTPNLFRALKEPVKLLVSTSNYKLFQFPNRLFCFRCVICAHNKFVMFVQCCPP